MSVNAFRKRLDEAHDFEQQVVDRFRLMGWHAAFFGQSQLDQQQRDMLKDFCDTALNPTLLRWMPDILVSKKAARGGTYVALIDAKKCNGVNYAVEISAVETAEIFVDRLRTPTFFVFNDYAVLTPRDARQRGRHHDGNGTNGSSTPFLLIDKRWARPLHQVFPPVA